MPTRRLRAAPTALTSRCAAALALLAAACADPATAPRSAPAATPHLDVSAPSLVGTTPPLIPNTVKYRDAGQHPATGRSGTATLTTRALLAKDGTTLLEVTTGALDAGTPAPGRLEKVQLTTLDPKGTQIGDATNYTKLPGGGYASFTLPGLGRGFQLRTQANITGIDPRADVATVTTPVVLRPDLAVTAFSPPQTALVNAPVRLAATVRELNGDLGARADCVLYVDGTAVDRSNGIWVDAASTVTCAFTYAFPSTGTKQLRVALEQVAPADWDPTNNAATGTIAVVTNGAATLGYAYDAKSATSFTDNWAWTYGTGTLGSGSGTWQFSGTGHAQAESFVARLDRALPAGTTLAYTVSSGGTTLYTTTVSGVGAAAGNSMARQQGTFTSASGGPGTPTFLTVVFTQVVTGYDPAAVTPDNPTGGWAMVALTRDAGAATYQSANTGAILTAGQGASASFTYSISAMDNAGHPLTTDPVVAYTGTELVMQVDASSASGSSTSVLRVPLVAFDVTGTPPFGSAPTCAPTIAGSFTWTHCYTNQQSRVVGRGGWAIGQPGSATPVASGGWF